MFLFFKNYSLAEATNLLNRFNRFVVPGKHKQDMNGMNEKKHIQRNLKLQWVS